MRGWPKGALIGKQVWALLVVGTTIAAPAWADAGESDVRAVIAKRFRDPESALFRNLRKSVSTAGWCGEVNAKNGDGVYVGFQQFFVFLPDMLVLEGEPDPVKRIMLPLLPKECPPNL